VSYGRASLVTLANSFATRDGRNHTTNGGVKVPTEKEDTSTPGDQTERESSTIITDWGAVVQLRMMGGLGVVGVSETRGKPETRREVSLPSVYTRGADYRTKHIEQREIRAASRERRDPRNRPLMSRRTGQLVIVGRSAVVASAPAVTALPYAYRTGARLRRLRQRHHGQPESLQDAQGRRQDPPSKPIYVHHQGSLVAPAP
jgi:hypothetical protein